MTTQLRPPSLNERRCIIRHELGFYRGIATAAVYKLEGVQSLDSESCLKLFGPALQQCVKEHPIMGAVIDDPDSEAATFRRLKELQLRQHVHFLGGQDTIVPAQGFSERPEKASNDHTAVPASLEKDDTGGQSSASPRMRSLCEKTLEQIVNLPFPNVAEAPPWRLFILPALDGTSADNQHGRLLVVYNYSHSHGDGLSGLAFHLTFRQALSSPIDQDSKAPSPAVIKTGSAPLPAPTGPWPLSWSFFLGVLANEFIPWLPKLLFWRTAQHGRPWTGRSIFFDKQTFRTGVRVIAIDADELNAALRRCKANGIKLTGLLHLLIVRGLHSTLKARDITHQAFTSSTPVDLRAVFGLPANSMSNGASAVSHPFSPPESVETLTERELQSARELGEKLVKCSSTTHDQIVGLLSYAGPIGNWLRGKIGKSRSDTYELSNTMSFDPVGDAKEAGMLGSPRSSRVGIDSICWTQPADAVGQVFSVNVVSLKGGDLSIAITWQYGALGIVKEDSNVTAAAEDEFMNDLSSAIQSEFVRWADNST